MDAGNKELLFVLILIGALFIIGVIALFIFVKQWRKEHPNNEQKRERRR